jgi:hypothetical protein
MLMRAGKKDEGGEAVVSVKQLDPSAITGLYT